MRVAQYPGQFVLQDVLTLHGSQFRDAAVIVASPPCQNYSYLAMPWSRSKPIPCAECDATGWKTAYDKCQRCKGKGEIEFSKAAKALRLKWETEGPDNRLFDVCFRIQREAIEATRKTCGACSGSGRQIWKQDVPDCVVCNGRGYTERYIPLIVENVRGAQPWVGRSAWNYGSFHLWGDVPALMPFANRVAPKRAMDDLKNGVCASHLSHLPIGAGTNHPTGSWFRIADSSQGDRGGVKQLNPRGDNATAGRNRMGLGGVKVPGQVHGTEYAFTRTGANGQTVLGTREAQLERVVDLVKAHPETAPVVLQIAIDGQKARSEGGWFGDGKHGRTRKADPRDVRRQPDGSYMTTDGTKIGGDWFSDPNSTCRKHGSRSNARKAASAMIAKIPFELARHIAAVYYPRALAEGGRLADAAGKS